MTDQEIEDRAEEAYLRVAFRTTDDPIPWDDLPEPLKSPYRSMVQVEFPVRKGISRSL